MAGLTAWAGPVRSAEGAVRDVVFQHELAGYSAEAYAAGVEALVRAYEERRGEPIKPGEKGRAGLKVYAESGAGMSTPPELVRALLASLEARGYGRENIIIVGRSERSLRDAGLLPPLSVSRELRFAGAPVYVLDNGEHWRERWFYESPLPSREHFLEQAAHGSFAFEEEPVDRKSFLPAPLFLDTDFWVNLPIFISHRAVGVSGALANASIWGVSNYKRFLNSPASEDVATTEIAAIPEIKETWVFTLASLEHYQFIGGTQFAAQYSGSEPVLWLSANPVVLDYLMWQRFNRHREQRGLPLIQPRPLIFEYARGLGLGDFRPSGIERVSVPRGG